MVVDSRDLIEVLEPIAPPDAEPKRLSERPSSLSDRALVIYDGNEQNARELLDDLADLLSERHGISRLRYRARSGRRGYDALGGEKTDTEADPARDAATGQVAVVGVGHCGCVVWCVDTAVALEQAGIPSVVVATDAFAAMGQTSARTLGLGGLPIVSLPHPFDSLSRDQVRVAAERIVGRVEAALTGRAEDLEALYSAKEWPDTDGAEGAACAIPTNGTEPQ